VPTPYLEVQRLLESPPGERYHAESAYLAELDDERIALLVDHAARARSPGDELVVLPWNGSIVRSVAGPLARPQGWLLHALTHWRSATDDAAKVA
jgi:hypothetical protein